jgi:hypothetical protein
MFSMEPGGKGSLATPAATQPMTSIFSVKEAGCSFPGMQRLVAAWIVGENPASQHRAQESPAVRKFNQDWIILQ